MDAEEHETKEELESHVDFSWWNNDLTEGEGSETCTGYGPCADDPTEGEEE